MKCCFIILLLSLTSIINLKSQNSSLLTGVPISSSNILTSASYTFDDNMNTYFKSKDASYSWVGLDLGKEHIITRIEYVPGNENMQTALFEGANDPSFLDAIPLNLIKKATTSGVKYIADINVSKGFRYVRFLGANGQYGVAIGLKFYGYEGIGTNDQFYKITNLPTIIINTDDKKDILTKSYRGGNITIIDENGKLSHNTNLEIRGRGNASWNFDKKGFRIKLDKKAKILDAPAKSKNWTLIADYTDRSLIRNLMAFDLSNKFGLYYTPYCRGVDVIVNGEYRGNYMLCDQIEVNKNRVNINELTPEDTTTPQVDGDYLIEIDSYASEGLPQAHFYSKKTQIPVTIKSPKDDKIVAEQNQYISTWFSKMEEALYAANYQDPINGYKKYLDIESFAKYFLLEELTGNNDAFQSVYMIKKKGDDKFYTGPAWDFDWSFQNLIWNLFPTKLNEQSNYWNLTKDQNVKPMNGFLKRIISDPAMDNEIKKLWNITRTEKGVTHEYIAKRIQFYVDLLNESRILNFVRWPKDAPSSYSDEITHITDYTLNRLSFIDRLVYNEKQSFPGIYRLQIVNSQNITLTQNGNNVTLAPSNNNLPQDWYLHQNGLYYTIRPASNINLAITVSGTDNNPVFALASVNAASTAQLWSVFKGKDGFIHIISRKNAKALTLDNNNLTFDTFKNIDNQKFDIKFSKLYMAGDATSAGWNISSLLSLPLKDDSLGVFTWTGVLNKGTLKFQLTKNTSWLPAVNAVSDNRSIDGENDLMINTTNQNDFKFRVNDKSIYSITADLNNLKIRVVKEDLKSDELIDANYCIKLLDSDLTLNYTSNLSQVELNNYQSETRDWRIIPAGDYYTIRPISSTNKAIAVGTGNSISISNYNGSDSQLWSIFKTTEGSFLLMSKANNQFLVKKESQLSFGSYSDAQKFDIKYSKLYLVGDATSAGWSIPNLISLPVKNDSIGVFTWTGILNKGSFKFQLTRNSNWLPTLNAISDNHSVAGLNDLVINTISQNDFKFEINDKSIYTITADLNNLKMRVVKENLKSDDLIDANYCIKFLNSDQALTYTKDISQVALSSYLSETRDWRIIPVGNYYTIRPIALTNKAITAVGTSVAINNYNGSDSQLWSIFKTADGSFIMMSKSNNKFLINKNSQLLFGTYSEAQKFEVKYSKLYLVGDATVAGWNISKIISLPLYENKLGVFVWNGMLNPGNFKFQLTRNTSWLPVVSAAYDNQSVNDVVDLVINTTYNDDFKFRTNDKANYTIIVNLNSLKMNVSKSFSTKDLEVGSLNSGNLFYAIGLANTIKIQANEKVDLVRVYNLDGVLVGSVKNAIGTFNIGDNLVRGVYIVEFTNGNFIEQQKVMVQ